MQTGPAEADTVGMFIEPWVLRTLLVFASLGIAYGVLLWIESRITRESCDCVAAGRGARANTTRGATVPACGAGEGFRPNLIKTVRGVPVRPGPSGIWRGAHVKLLNFLAAHDCVVDDRELRQGAQPESAPHTARPERSKALAG
jgi:hypothetical protein